MTVFARNLLRVLATLSGMNASGPGMPSALRSGPGARVRGLHYFPRLPTGLPGSSLALQGLRSTNGQGDTLVTALSGSLCHSDLWPALWLLLPLCPLCFPENTQLLGLWAFSADHSSVSGELSTRTHKTYLFYFLLFRLNIP